MSAGDWASAFPAQPKSATANPNVIRLRNGPVVPGITSSRELPTWRQRCVVRTSPLLLLLLWMVGQFAGSHPVTAQETAAPKPDDRASARQVLPETFLLRDEQGKLSDDRLRELAAHPQVRMFELKLSQGAKPGKGGLLPGEKVSEEIAAIRGIEVGQDSISPNRHREIDSVQDLFDMINHIREVTGKPTGFKIVLGDRQFAVDLCQVGGIQVEQGVACFVG